MPSHTRLLIAAEVHRHCSAGAHRVRANARRRHGGEASSSGHTHAEMSVSTTNRAEVQAEAQRATRSGELDSGRYHEEAALVLAESTKTRAERKAETLQAARTTS